MIGRRRWGGQSWNEAWGQSSCGVGQVDDLQTYKCVCYLSDECMIVYRCTPDLVIVASSQVIGAPKYWLVGSVALPVV